MNLKSTVILFSLIALFAKSTFACSPLPQERFAHTKERVREKFDSVDSVELMTLIEEKFVKIPMFLGDNLLYETLRATFRVVRVFKGNSKPGDIIVFHSSSTCSRSAVHPKVFVPPGSKYKIRNHPREWLIYRRAEFQTQIPSNEPPIYRNEITDSPMTQSIDEARDEIKFLEELRVKSIR